MNQAHVLVAGFTLGALAAARLLIRGQILGISGYLRNLCKLKLGDGSEALFLLGLVAAGILLSQNDSDAIEKPPASFTIKRSAVAGALVGAGTGLGNGCTSGHGVCGCARLSPRSIIFMAITLACSVGTSKVFASSLAVMPSSSSGQISQEVMLQTSVSLLMMAILLCVAVGFFGQQDPVSQAARARAPFAAKSITGPAFTLLAGDFGQGVLFAYALALAGLLKPSKVVAGLDIGGPRFDSSLWYAMVAAFVGAFPGFLTVYRIRLTQSTHSLSGAAFPTSSRVVDFTLILSAILFGIGWGLAGVCPGPALVTVTGAAPQTVAFVTTMMATYIALPRLQHCL